jgi:hypothetical protein
MKKILFSIFIISIILLIGCQENSITDPVQEDLQKNDTQLFHQGAITLGGDLADPRGLFNDNYKLLTIFGAVKFEHRFEYSKDIQPQPYVSLHLSMIAEITDRNTTQDITYPIWSLSGESLDIIYFSDNNDSNSILYKYYAIRGSNVGMRLVCKFFVTTNGVSLSDYRLQLQNTDGSYPDINEG